MNVDAAPETAAAAAAAAANCRASAAAASLPLAAHPHAHSLTHAPTPTLAHRHSHSLTHAHTRSTRTHARHLGDSDRGVRGALEHLPGSGPTGQTARADRGPQNGRTGGMIRPVKQCRRQTPPPPVRRRRAARRRADFRARNRSRRSVDAFDQLRLTSCV